MAPMKSGPPRRDPELTGTLSLAQLARRWKIPCRRIRRMLGRQQLGFIDICGSFRIPLAAIERYERHHRPH